MFCHDNQELIQVSHVSWVQEKKEANQYRIVIDRPPGETQLLTIATQDEHSHTRPYSNETETVKGY